MFIKVSAKLRNKHEIGCIPNLFNVFGKFSKLKKRFLKKYFMNYFKLSNAIICAILRVKIIEYLIINFIKYKLLTHFAT